MLLLLILAISIVLFLILNLQSKWFLSRSSKLGQYVGAAFSNIFAVIGILVLTYLTLVSYGYDREELSGIMEDYQKLGYYGQLWSANTKYLFIATLTAMLIYFVSVLRTLTKIFCLRKEEIRITWCQFAKLLAFFIWIAAIFIVLGSSITNVIPITALGTVLGWAFQDSIKGAWAFIQFRLKGMLNIGDWIIVEQYGVDGFVKSVSLGDVEIENWDSTTSIVPMSYLSSGQLQNMQKMQEGRTHGRRMIKEFIINSSFIHSLRSEEVDKLREVLGESNSFFVSKVIVGHQNIQLFREYVEYYLLSHPRVSHEPRLLVSWVKQTGEGIVLQVYAFIIDTRCMEFENRQSEIIEHIIESMEWFGLKLYQYPSSFDSKSSTIYLANKDENEK